MSRPIRFIIILMVVIIIIIIIVVVLIIIIHLSCIHNFVTSTSRSTEDVAPNLSTKSVFHGQRSEVIQIEEIKVSIDFYLQKREDWELVCSLTI